MDGSVLTALGACAAAVIAAGSADLTRRRTNKTTAATEATASRDDMEKEAFVRAKGYYEGVITDQDREIATLRADLATEKRERSEEITALRFRLTENERETTRLHVELDKAKRTIRALRASSSDDTDH